MQADYWVPQLEEAQLKWVDLAKESAVWTIEVRKVQKLKANVVELEKSNSQLRSLHQAEVERLCIIH